MEGLPSWEDDGGVNESRNCDILTFYYYILCIFPIMYIYTTIYISRPFDSCVTMVTSSLTSL